MLVTNVAKCSTCFPKRLAVAPNYEPSFFFTTAVFHFRLSLGPLPKTPLRWC